MADIYIVVDVSYDYYRFQENVFASTNIEDCLTWCNERDIIPLQYEYGDSIFFSLGKSEKYHHWIQVIKSQSCLIR